MRPNQISQTAAFISIKLYGLTRVEPYRSMFEKEVISFYSELVKTLPPPLGSYYSALQKKWLRKFFIFWEELLLPGDLMHILARKHYITRMVQAARERKDCEQLLILGAGFDHLAVQFSQKDILCFELDTPLMADLKKEFVHSHHFANPNLTIVPAFFSEDRLLDIMNVTTGLDPKKKTTVVAEGFFDYLSPSQAGEILADLTTFFSNKISLISTVFSLEELTAFKAFVFKSSIRMVGEKLSLYYNYPQFEELLAENKFIINEAISTRRMKKELLEPNGISLPLLDGFYVLRASTGV